MRTHKLVRCLGFPILACFVAMILACGAPPTSTPVPTPNVEETVQARLAEEATKRAEIERSIQQTLTAQPTAGPTPETPTRVPPTYTAPPTPTRVPPTYTPTPGAVVYHYVRYGETLASIGRLYGVSPYAIARANGLANPNCIYAGQVLLIPTCYPCPQGEGTTPSPEPEVVISAEQAIRDYYSLIMQKQYAVAWEMLSDEFNARMGITTLDKYISGWEESGPATIVEMEVVESNGRTTVTLILYYPEKKCGSQDSLRTRARYRTWQSSIWLLAI